MDGECTLEQVPGLFIIPWARLHLAQPELAPRFPA
jgi:hypothetical protein